ncbi:hypothetical protein A2870_00030 [Candidatus Curtissbacteria bacterium RIFCSPHIGHO2_01_FULL_41_11]|uniref:Uncharacterized protein n=1 Tax=Candidatus Curtissbacteria bacterium RIFCSPHIGHO2_01_FULL_41_11 TaxID=1797711 RepID=A0A1F5G608_9BACT|nr:MAG: hypothetical protein A2870_00030 [Candidatus Curtissbacteria bacterium RIFCSPHIGHO2_01_FULL_41_11]
MTERRKLPEGLEEEVGPVIARQLLTTGSISFDPKDESVVLQFDSLLPPLVETDRFYGGNFHKTMKDYLKESSQVRRSKN